MDTILRGSRRPHVFVGRADGCTLGSQAVRKTLIVQSPGRSGCSCFEDNSFHRDDHETTESTLGMHAVIPPRAQGCIYLDTGNSSTKPRVSRKCDFMHPMYLKPLVARSALPWMSQHTRTGS